MRRYVGLDLGTRSLGIAVSDVVGIVHAREEFLFPKHHYRLAVERVIALLDEEKIEDVVLGYPLNMDGSLSEGTLRSERFKGALLKERPGIHVYFQDERLSTLSADEIMREHGVARTERGQRIDRAAAALILEDFMAAKEREERE